MTAPIRPTVPSEGTIGEGRHTPLTPVQKMRANLEWMRANGKSTAEQHAEIERWKPKIAEYNQRELAQAGSFGNLAVQGATFNFADEIAGAADAVGAMVPGGQSPAEAYRSTKDAVTGTNRALREIEPGKALATEVGGGAATGVGTGLAVAKATLPAALRFLRPTVTATTRLGRLGQRVAPTVATAAAGGAAAGAGGAEPGERLRGAAIGAATAVPVALGLQGAGAGVSAVGKRLGMVGRAAGEAAGVVPQAAPDVTSAAEKVAAAVQATGKNIDELLAPTAKLDPTATLADVDVGGIRAARLAGTGRRLGEQASERVEETLGARTLGRASKMAADLGDISGVRSFHLEGEAEALAKRARTEARPFYDQLRQFPAVEDPRVAEAFDLLPESRVREFWKGVQDIARLEGRKTRNALGPDGKLAFPLEPAEMDLMKRALDEVIYSGGRQAKMAQPGGLTNAETALLKRARGLLVAAAEDATGGSDGVYAQARRIFAGPVSIKEALESGADVQKLSIEDLKATLAEMSPAQREAFARGAVQSMREGLEKVTPGTLRVPRRFQSARADEQMRAAMAGDPEKVAAFRRMVSGEASREQTEGIVMRGSPTAERLADDAGFETATVPTSGRGLIAGAVGRFAAPVERALRGMNAVQADEVTRVLTEPIGDPATRAKVLRYLNEGKTARAAQAAREAVRRAGIASTAAPEEKP